MLLPKNRLSPITAVILQKYLKKPLEHFYDIKYVCLRRGVIPRTGDDAISTLAGNCKKNMKQTRFEFLTHPNEGLPKLDPISEIVKPLKPTRVKFPTHPPGEIALYPTIGATI